MLPRDGRRGLEGDGEGERRICERRGDEKREEERIRKGAEGRVSESVKGERRKEEARGSVAN
jgi:hypothetical protein